MMAGAARWLLLGLAACAAPARADTDLLTAYRAALQHDALYLSAKAATASEKREVPKAIAGLLPSISLSGTATRNDTETVAKLPSGNITTDTLYWSKNYALSLRQPLYRKQSWAQFREAQSTAKRAEASLRQESQSTGLRVAAAYFEALLAQARLEMETAKKNTFAQTLSYAQKALNTGSGTLTDIHEIQARLDLAEAFRIEAENARENAVMALQALMNEPPGALVPLDSAKLPVTEDIGPVEDWLARAEAGNPALEGLLHDIETARQEQVKAKSGHYPSLDLIATHRRASNDVETSLNHDTKTSLIGAQVSVPIFSGGYAHASILQAEDRLDRARQRWIGGRREIWLNVRREHGNVRQNAAKVAALEHAVVSVEEALKGTEKGVVAGTRTTVDVLNAQDLVFRTRVELARASYDFAMSSLRLRDAAGSLDEAAIRSVNGWLQAAP